MTDYEMLVEILKVAVKNHQSHIKQVEDCFDRSPREIEVGKEIIRAKEGFCRNIEVIFRSIDLYGLKETFNRYTKE